MGHSMPVVSDLIGEDGKWVKSFGNSRVNKVQTESYVRWGNMMRRCRQGSAFQSKNPSYIGCSTSDTFADFQLFTDWHVRQVGYGASNYQLDKDILLAGNRVYSGDVCVLVPSQLNNFLLDHRGARGKWPQGVCYNTQNGKFVAQISGDSKRKHLGYYFTVDAAEEAYKIAKEAEARDWYERLLKREFVVDERVIERMRTWKLN